MSKTVRITLYVLSIVTLVIAVVLIAFRGNWNHSVYTQALQEDTENVTEEISVSATEEKEPVPAENPLGDTEEATEEETEEKQETTILFAGDVLINERVENYYDAEGITRIVSEELLQEMKNADIMMLNNEFQFSNQGTPMEDKQYTFETDPKYVSVLQDMGVDIVTLANNHTLDYGKVALSDTFLALDGAGIRYAGAGETKERAEEVQIFEINGMKFGFVAASRVLPAASWKVSSSQPGIFSAYEEEHLREVIAAAKEECDFLTLYIHWGLEREVYPESYQTTLAAHCFESGADLIIGAHSHCLQGIEFIDGKPVFYSLGNYIFKENAEQSAAVKVAVTSDGNVTYSLLPVYTEAGKNQLMEGEKAAELYQYMNEISFGVTVDEQGNVTE